ncbi:MAG: class I tRNA ligase family protein, partial [Pirellulales bacterium]
ATVSYKLRDWLFSRQRYWGEPIPILHGPDGEMRTVPDDDLPLLLPEVDDYRPASMDDENAEPTPMLSNASDEWKYVEIDGVRWERELNTMPQWAGSCWYYLRFIDPKNQQAPVGLDVEKAWMPVDLYVGGAEHAVLHLLYARFWHKVLYDRGVNQGMILGGVEITGYQAEGGRWVRANAVTTDTNGNRVTEDGAAVRLVRVDMNDVAKSGDRFVLKGDPTVTLESRAHKMSKSRGNVVNPDEVVREYGADALRLYEMFMGPLEATKPWNMDGVGGVRSFLDRVWRMVVDQRSETMQLSAAIEDVEPTAEQNRMLHHTIGEVTRDVANLEFNTAISRMMEFTNFYTKEVTRPKSAIERFVLLLAPFAPHICEELWQVLGHAESLAYEPWPELDEAAVRQDEVEVVVQINGKVRGKVVIPTDAGRDAQVRAAREDPRIAAMVDGKQIVKTIAVPGRLVNFVVRG